MGRNAFGASCCAALALSLACGGAGGGPLQVTLKGPASALPAQGSRVVLQAVTQGAHSPAFQWFKDGRPIPGATSATLVLGPMAPADAGGYQVKVSDGATSLETEPFDLQPVDRPWVVTSAADAGPGTLRDTLAQANAASGQNGIEFALPAPYRIALLSALPAVTGKVCIMGPNGAALTVDGGGACRPLFLDGGTLVLDNFTLAHGLGKGGDGLGGGGGGAGMGGALFMNAGSLTLRRMTFLGSRAVGGSSLPGGTGENGGGGGFGGDSPEAGGNGADGGMLGGQGGPGWLDGSNAGGGSGGSFLGLVLPGGGGGEAGFLGGDGGKGSGLRPGQGGAGAGLGGALFLRAGSLAMTQCRFVDNHALPGDGDDTGGPLQALAEGKGGAVFIYAYDNAGRAPLFLDQLQAQSYSGNTATDLVESPMYDNNDYYIAQTLLPAVRRGSPLDLLHRSYHRARSLALPWAP